MALFTTPPRIIFGQGCFVEAGKETRRLGKRCLIVTGRSFATRSGLLEKFKGLLTCEGVTAEIFNGVEHDPSCATVDLARKAIRECGCDAVAGLGGGSALDVAKAAAALWQEDEPTRAFYDGLPIPGRGLPIICIPTTFGTGSEATRVSVLSASERDDEGREIPTKKSIRHDCMLPQTAIVDPDLGLSMPPALTAACGMDALAQAIESYVSRHANALSDAMALQAVRLLVAGLPRSVEDGRDKISRAQCANGSLLAGIALHNARLGLVHGMAHPLGIRYSIPHGEICAMLLPHVLRFNQPANAKKYDILSGLVGKDIADFCASLIERFGLPLRLQARISDKARQEIIKETLSSGSTQANPRNATDKNIEDILNNITP